MSISSPASGNFAREPSATTILELLTHPNPPVIHPEPNSKGNTHSRNFFPPEKVEKWTDFDPKLLKVISDGRLLTEACRERDWLPAYPFIDHDTDCVLVSEPSTRDLLGKWNKTIVTAALVEMQSEFRPVKWFPGDITSDLKKVQWPLNTKQGENRRGPHRRSSEGAKIPKQRSRARLQPDSGSIALNAARPYTDSDPVPSHRERFPKEYKLASKWESVIMWEKGLITEDGIFVRGLEGIDAAMPLKQAYTYCADNLCRYGCILSCKELFIFRIKPLERKPIDPSNDTRRTMEQALRSNGLLQYVSIPWSEYSRNKAEVPNNWTINLALWFMHILAGGESAVDWDYAPLVPDRVEPQAIEQGIDIESPKEFDDADDTASLESNVGQGKRKRTLIGDSDEIDGNMSDESETTVPDEGSPEQRKRKKVSDGDKESEKGEGDDHGEDGDDFATSFDDRQFS